MTDQQLLSLSEAAERYHIPITTLRNAVQRGDITGRKIGNQWVVDARSVEASLPIALGGADLRKKGPANHPDPVYSLV